MLYHVDIFVYFHFHTKTRLKLSSVLLSINVVFFLCQFNSIELSKKYWKNVQTPEFYDISEIVRKIIKIFKFKLKELNLFAVFCRKMQNLSDFEHSSIKYTLKIRFCTMISDISYYSGIWTLIRSLCALAFFQSSHNPIF